MKDMNRIIKLKETTAKDLMKSFNKRKKEQQMKINDMPMFRQMERCDVVDTKFSPFINFEFNYNPELSCVIKTLGWGSNRVIRQQGFRFLPITEDICHIKQWKRITDPAFSINESCYISKPKGQSIAVIHIGNFPNGCN